MRHVIDPSSGRRAWETGAYWMTNISQSGSSRCVLELDVRRFSRTKSQPGVITILVTPAGAAACPLYCTISTSDHQGI